MPSKKEAMNALNFMKVTDKSEESLAETVRSQSEDIRSLQSAIRRQHDEASQSIEYTASVKTELEQLKKNMSDLIAHVNSLGDHVKKHLPQ